METSIQIVNEKLENKRFLAITEIYAFIVTEEGGEGILGMKLPNGDWLPFIGADTERVNALKSLADKIGIPYKIRFFKLEDKCLKA